jgi:hypothetical protein
MFIQQHTSRKIQTKSRFLYKIIIRDEVNGQTTILTSKERKKDGFSSAMDESGQLLVTVETEERASFVALSSSGNEEEFQSTSPIINMLDAYDIEMPNE